MGILCDVYDQLPRDLQYKVALASLIVKLNNILSGPERPVEKLKKAKDLADRIYSRFREKEIGDIVKSLDLQLRLSSLVDQAIDSLNRALSFQNIDQAFQGLNDSAEQIKKILSMPEASNYLSPDQAKYFNDFVNDINIINGSGLKDLLNNISETIGRINSFLSSIASRSSSSIDEAISFSQDLWSSTSQLISTTNDLENRLNQVVQKLGDLKILRGLRDVLSSTTLSSVRQMKRLLQDYNAYASISRNIFETLKNFTSIVSTVGQGDNLLANKDFANKLVASLASHLNAVKNALDDAQLSRLIENKDLRDGLKQFALNHINMTLKEYKMSLASSDYRWMDIFNSAENASGVGIPGVDENVVRENFKKNIAEIIDKSKDEVIKLIPDPLKPLFNILLSAQTQIAKAVVDAFIELAYNLKDFDRWATSKLSQMREGATLLLNRSADPVARIAGGVLAVGTGILDTISLIIRPDTLIKTFSSVFEMLSGGLENIKRKGLQGLQEDLIFLANQMFGSLDRALYTAGTMVGAYLIAGAGARLPVPSTLRGVVTDLALGDPVSPFIRVITAERPITLLRNVVVTRAGEVVENSKVFNASEYVNKLREFLVQKVARFSDQVERSVKALEDNIKSIMKSKGSIEASISDIKQGVLRYGIDGLRDLALKYIDFVDKYVKPFSASDVVKLLKDLTESIYLKEFKPGLELTKLKYEFFRKSYVVLPSRPDFKSLIGGFEYVIQDLKKTYEAVSKAQKSLGLAIRKITIPEALINRVSKIVSEDLRTLSNLLAIHELRRLVFTSERARDMIVSSRDALKFLEVFSQNLPEDLRKTISTKAVEITSKASTLEKIINEIESWLKKAEERLREAEKTKVEKMLTSEEAFQRVKNLFKDFTEDLEKIVREHPDLQKLIDINKIREEIPNIKNIDDLRALVNNEILSKLRGYVTSESIAIIEKFGKILDALSKDPQVASRFKSFIETLVSNINEMVRVELPRFFVINLSPKTLELLIEASKKTLPFTKPQEIYDALKKAYFEKRLTLSELEKITDAIAKEKPIKAGRIEVQALIDALRSILEDVRKGIEKIPPEMRQYFVEAVKNVEGKIYEAERVLFLGAEMTKMKVIEGLSSAIRRESETVLSLLKEVSPTLEEKLRTSLDKLSREISAGKISDATIKEVMNVLREASDTLRKTGVMPGQLKRTLLRFISDLKEGASEDVQLAKLLSPIADELIRILNTIPEIEGWGFVSLDISTSRAGMLMASPEVRQWIREEIAKGRTVKEVKIGDVSIRLYKNVVLDPKTNTFTVEYRLVYPEGREAVIGLSTRITDGYVHRTFYSSMDPVLVQAYKDYASGNVKSSLYKLGESLDELYKDPQRFMEMIDPDFDKWKNIAVYGSNTGLVRIGDLLNASVTGLVNILSTAKLEAKPPEKLTTEDQLFLASASAPKNALINATRPLITATPDEIAQEVVSKGYSPVGYVNPKIFITEYIAPAIEKLMKTNNVIRRRILDFFNNPDILRQLGMSFSDIMKSIGVEGFLKNIFNVLPTTMLIDLVDKMRSSIPEIQDLIKKITWALDNIIVYAVPSPKPFIPSKDEWTVIKIGDQYIPVPIIGRFMGKRITIVPIMTERIAQEFQTKIAPVQTQAQVQLPFLTLQYITPESAINVPTSTEIPVAGMPLTIVSLFGVAPSLGPLAGGERRGVGRGIQREVLTIL